VAAGEPAATSTGRHHNVREDKPDGGDGPSLDGKGPVLASGMDPTLAAIP